MLENKLVFCESVTPAGGAASLFILSLGCSNVNFFCDALTLSCIAVMMLMQSEKLIYCETLGYQIQK